jgi:thiamine biosynthesis lipoprotein
MDRRRFSVGLLVTAGLQSRARAADPQVQHDARAAMGTRVRITVVHPSPTVRSQALDAAWAQLQALTDMMSRYRSANALQDLARHAGSGAWQAVPQPLLQVLQMAQAASAFTSGAYDATVGAYRDWHFEPGAAPQVVSPVVLNAQRERVGWRALQVDAARGTARLARPGMSLDLGGIAKLPILKATLQALLAQGVEHAMVDGGGDVLCRGQLLGRDWRVGVRDPLAPGRLLGVLSLSDGVVASSGDYERRFEQGGRLWHHVLDPATGWPTRGVHGVALCSTDIASLNGLGPAIMVAGLSRARQWLTVRPEIQAMVATPGGHWMTPALAARLRPVAAS